MKMTREEKTLWRIKRFVGPLIDRRDFIVALASAGVTLTAAEDLMAVDLQPPDAVWVAVAIFDEATGRIAEKDANVKTIQDFLAKYPNAYIGTNNDDGWDKNTNMYDDNKNKGPKTAREWLIWRVLASFKKGQDQTLPPAIRDAHDFNKHRGYVLANAAMMGELANKYKPSANNQVKIAETAKAFYEIKAMPIVERSRGGFCDA
jgi:hypothetical protein